MEQWNNSMSLQRCRALVGNVIAPLKKNLNITVTAICGHVKELSFEDEVSMETEKVVSE